MSVLKASAIGVAFISVGVGIGHIGTNALNDWQVANAEPAPESVMIADTSCASIGQQEGLVAVNFEAKRGADNDHGPMLYVVRTEIETRNDLMGLPRGCFVTTSETIGYAENFNFAEFPVLEGDQSVDLADSFVSAISEVGLQRALENLHSDPIVMVHLGRAADFTPLR